MRVNVYAEEMTNRIEIVEKETKDGCFTGVRFYLELPATVKGVQHRGPFIHHPGDDDSSAVTFWGKGDMRKTLARALDMLDAHYLGVTLRDEAAREEREAARRMSHAQIEDVCVHVSERDAAARVEPEGGGR